MKAVGALLCIAALWALLLQVGCAALPKGVKMDRDETIRRLEGEVSSLRLSMEATVGTLRKQALALGEDVDRERDLVERLQREVEAERVAKQNALDAADKYHRLLVQEQRSVHECTVGRNALSVQLTQCEQTRAADHTQLLELQRANDLLEGDVRNVHSQEEAMRRMKRAHEEQQQKWREMERKHHEQVSAFHEEAYGEADTAALDEDPHPDVGSVTYFAQLKAQEEAYRREVARRREVDEANEAARAASAVRQAAEAAHAARNAAPEQGDPEPLAYDARERERSL